MNRRLIAWAIRLYPADWLDRYGEELTATVEDMPAPSLAAVWNIFTGALAMRAKQGGSMKRTILISGLMGLAIAWGFSLRIADQYLSESVLRPATLDGATLHQSIDRLLNRQFLVNLIEKHKLYEAERCCIPLEDVVEMTKRNVRVALTGDQTGVHRNVSVAFKYPNAATAQRVTTDLAAALIRQENSGQFTLLDAASAPAPIYPNRRNIAFSGLLGGTIIGAGWAFLRGRKAKLAS